MGRIQLGILRIDGKGLDSGSECIFRLTVVSARREPVLSSTLAIESHQAITWADALQCCIPMEESLTLCSAYWDGGCLQRKQLQVGLQGSVSCAEHLSVYM